jgi:hypothetical protein
MAISAPHYRLFKSLSPILPHGGTLLEIGEANWYGDVDPQMLYVDCSQYHPTGQESSSDLPAVIKSGNLFAIAKAFYAATFAPSKIVSVDLGGLPNALRQDLNAPLDLGGEQFDLVINHGTAEHIFNIAQVFRTMHDHCIDGGLMIHDAPFTGWIDHGFYTLQPTLFYDVAAANNYEIALVAVTHIDLNLTIRLESREHLIELRRDGKIPADGAMLFVVFRKLCDAPFRIPMQGYYARSLSKSGNKAWEEMR